MSDRRGNVPAGLPFPDSGLFFIFMLLSCLLFPVLSTSSYPSHALRSSLFPYFYYPIYCHSSSFYFKPSMYCTLRTFPRHLSRCNFLVLDSSLPCLYPSFAFFYDYLILYGLLFGLRYPLVNRCYLLQDRGLNKVVVRTLSMSNVSYPILNPCTSYW